MGKINSARVLIGGLVAGVVLTGGNFLANELLFADVGAELFERMGIEVPGGTQIAIFIALSFVIGVVLIWLYAAIRPRFGPGVNTAFIAAMTAWFFASLLASVNFAVLMLISPGQAAIGTVYDLVFFTIAGVAGALLYQESGSASA